MVTLYCNKFRCVNIFFSCLSLTFILSFCLSLIETVCQGLTGLEILILTRCLVSEWGWTCFVKDCFLFKCVCKIANSDCWPCHNRLCVCPSVHMEQLGPHWMDFYEIVYFSIFWKCVEKIQVSLKSGKNNWYFAWSHMCIYDNISPNSS
jgi:hypothetical protein